MKKIFAVLLILSMLLVLAACTVDPEKCDICTVDEDGDGICDECGSELQPNVPDPDLQTPIIPIPGTGN